MNALNPHLMGQLPAISQQIWEMKYRLPLVEGAAEASLEASFWRVAKAVALAEKPELQQSYAQQFYELMADLRFLPAYSGIPKQAVP